MKILIVSTMPSHPVDAGNRAAIMSQVMLLKKLGYDVHYLFAEMSLQPKSYKEMKDYWGDKLHIFNMNIITKIYRLAMDKIRIKLYGGYWRCDDHYPWGIACYLSQLNRMENFDAIIVQYMRLSRLLVHTDIPRKAIYTHDVFSYKDLRTGAPFYETCDAREEAKAMQRCPNIFAIQQDEATYFKMLSPLSHVRTVYNSYKTHHQQPVHNNCLLYLASRMSFNVSGIRWFLDNVWQLLKEKDSSIKLIIGGTVCESLKNTYKDVILLGKIKNLQDFYVMGDIVINPVCHGTGLKIKTFEALSYGKATIVHPHSMTGIYDVNHAPILVASSPEEWVKTILNLVHDTRFADELGLKGLKYIGEMNHYIMEQYKEFLNTSNT